MTGIEIAYSAWEAGLLHELVTVSVTQPDGLLAS